MAKQYLQLQGNGERRRRQGWTAYQLSKWIALERFEAVRDRWKVYEDDRRREAAMGCFYEFAYQWY